MHVVALCSQKGGSGKTTLAGHLAVQAELAGMGPVALVDTDPQGSASPQAHRTGIRSPQRRKSAPGASSSTT
jgi:anion-transporting  ArsA/GET3 family ATPase